MGNQTGWAFATVIVLLGCGDSHGRTLASDGGMLLAVGDKRAQEATDCMDFARALCARRFECIPLAYTQGHGFGDAYRDEGLCAERMAIACASWQHLPGTRITPSELARCATELQALDCHLATYSLTLNTGGCAIARGTFDGGTACDAGMQCSSSRCERGVSSDAGTTCAVGEPVAPIRVDEPCRQGFCGEDLRCIEGVCSAPALLGEACNDGNPPCATYAEVHCESGTCVSHPTGLGACGSHLSSAGYSACADGECVARNDFGLGRCAAYAEDGAACEPYGGAACLFPARCIDRRCVLPR
jgi:hypothetical protein